MNRRLRDDFDDEMEEMGYRLRFRNRHDHKAPRSVEDEIPRKRNRVRSRRNSTEYERY